MSKSIARFTKEALLAKVYSKSGPQQLRYASTIANLGLSIYRVISHASLRKNARLWLLNLSGLTLIGLTPFNHYIGLVFLSTTSQTQGYVQGYFMFRSEPIAKHRMREGRKTVVQPLETNAGRGTGTQGMARVIMDFDEQMGIDLEAADRLLSWVRGDGAGYATTLRLHKYLCSMPDNQKSFRNRIAIPEIWHAKATMINSIAANHYGPTTSQDPSSLSRSSGAAGFKRPANLSSCDYYPIVRSMSLIWEAQVLDCWRWVDSILALHNRISNIKYLQSISWGYTGSSFSLRSSGKTEWTTFKVN